MATNINDLVALYRPDVDYFDPTPLLVALAQVGVTRFTFPPEFIQFANALNAETKAAIDAVGVYYTGSTDAEFTAWTAERIAAIDARLSMISATAKGIIKLAEETARQLGKGIKIANGVAALASLVPGGQAIGLVAGLQSKGIENEVLNAQLYNDVAIRKLSNEVALLQQLRADIEGEVFRQAELVKNGGGSTPGAWVYWVSGGVTLLFLVATGWYYWHRRASQPT